jgi:hypothetical protein
MGSQFVPQPILIALSSWDMKGARSENDYGPESLAGDHWADFQAPPLFLTDKAANGGMGVPPFL